MRRHLRRPEVAHNAQRTANHSAHTQPLPNCCLRTSAPCAVASDCFVRGVTLCTYLGVLAGALLSQIILELCLPAGAEGCGSRASPTHHPQPTRRSGGTAPSPHASRPASSKVRDFLSAFKRLARSAGKLQSMIDPSSFPAGYLFHKATSLPAALLIYSRATRSVAFGRDFQ